jgi:hypothetical protein
MFNSCKADADRAEHLDKEILARDLTISSLKMKIEGLENR